MACSDSSLASTRSDAANIAMISFGNVLAMESSNVGKRRLFALQRSSIVTTSLFSTSSPATRFLSRSGQRRMASCVLRSESHLSASRCSSLQQFESFINFETRGTYFEVSSMGLPSSVRSSSKKLPSFSRVMMLASRSMRVFHRSSLLELANHCTALLATARAEPPASTCSSPALLLNRSSMKAVPLFPETSTLLTTQFGTTSPTRYFLKSDSGTLSLPSRMQPKSTNTPNCLVEFVTTPSTFAPTLHWSTG
mmetsp:Transcript_26211/g.56858  ORF Transcript_26211/g.56858 Transcript_26211/m.56858 type:complete len:252 (+) Transcript_26211:242-997(+)